MSQFELRRDISRTIKDQDKDLIGYENNMINTGIMLIAFVAGYFARKAAIKMLDKYF